ncbi:hypothetical protein GZH82_08270 [Staphylococcus ursi]|uniref:hypothetical protein n=1 Tax=Staphylococcus sp. MI 10-1553 TaxID=1912064 RepID=UPI0013981BA5|nr:hypothetical protein [Staphylococcus sp. MI 10-1553]QHW35880.1 hypothetical protein GZH82_08270 [Staphylococcus sp. MI 10-1553]
MQKLARHILHRASVIECPVTQIHLQKVLYFTIGFMLQHDQKLARDLFEHDEKQAWLYGPVVPNIDAQYQQYRKRGITDEGDVCDVLNTDRINMIIDILIQVNPFKNSGNESTTSLLATTRTRNKS